MNSTRRYAITMAAVLAATIGILIADPAVALAGTIGHQLQQHLPAVVDYLNERNLKTVGVLKFRVKQPGQKSSDRVGPLNSLLADRVEVGLILANPFDDSRQLRIIKNASAQASNIQGANHLNAEGRAAFFGPSFKLCWGDDLAAADAFLTGVVQVHQDYQHATIGILCFDKHGGPIERACDVFDVELDATSLSEMGASFVLRGAFDGGRTQLTAQQQQERQQTLVRNEVANVKSQQSSFPLADPAAPVKLEVRYDGQPMQWDLREGQAFLPEPKEHQQVEIEIMRGSGARGTLAVVLKVNGENTLYRQTIRDIDCAKWILNPDTKRTIVRGYQLRDRKTIEKFKVLSDAESSQRAIDYGRNVGQIQLTVFRELSERKPQPRVLDEEEEDLVAMLRGVQPDSQPANLSALKGQIRNGSQLAGLTGGIIVQGERASNQVRVVKFKPDPTPIMAATITYYTP